MIGLSLTSAVNLTAPRTVRADPGVLYAAPNGMTSGACDTWANACTLQYALSIAVSGDEIWVQAGVHYPGAAGNRTATFTLKNGVALYGGFAGTETSRDQRDWQANPTILSGDIDQNDVNDDGNYIAETWNDIRGENAYHVVTGSGTNDTAVLDGLIITAGQANGSSSPNDRGGGMHNNSGSPTLTNVTFSGNAALWWGGGMHNFSSSPTLVNVAFRGNSALADGGGMSNRQGSSPTLTNVTFSSNSATYTGGGMRNYDESHPTLINVVFRDNSAGEGGGMENWWHCSPTLINVTFSGNSATESGGGMTNGYESNPILTNVILWNSTAISGTSIYNLYSTPTISYSDIQDCGGSGAGWNAGCGADGGGNIEADPLFVDPASGNLRLQLASPAIDAGNNAAVPPGVVTDLDGNPRFMDMPTVPDSGNGTPPIVDMGAYEVQYVDVALDKAVVPQAVAPGETITFALTLTNAGSLPVTGIIVTDTLPAWLWGASFTSTLTLTDTGALPPYVWLVQDLARGQSGVITISGVLTLPLAAGTYTNTAFISATGDLLTENNTAVIAFSVPNIAPGFTSAPVITATQDAPYTYTATAGDDNGDALTITAPTLPAWLTLEDHGDGTATLSGTPANADVGDHAVLLQVTDSGGLTGTQAFTVTVLNFNDAPTFTSAPVLTATQGLTYTYAVTTDDPDLVYGDALTLTAPTLPAWLTLTDYGDGTATLAGTPANADVGEHPVVLRVTDSSGLFAEQSFTVTVLNVNDAPFFTSAPVLTATQDAPYTYTVAADDPDLIHGDALTITAPTLPAWLTLSDHGDGTATLSGTPANADVGEHPLVLRVTDSSGLFAEQSFTVTVLNVNDAPFFTSAPVLTATQDAPYTYTVAADDPDLIHGDALTITAPTLPAWLSLEDHGDGTATLAGTPTSPGDYPVVLRVTDRSGASAEQSFTISVAERPRHYIFLPLVLRRAP